MAFLARGDPATPRAKVESQAQKASTLDCVGFSP